MDTLKIIQHFNKLEEIKNLIINETHQVEQLENLKTEKNWLFYGHDEVVSEKLKYSHTLEIKRSALERLKNRYINELTKLN